jgi:hypothetical protein
VVVGGEEHDRVRDPSKAIEEGDQRLDLGGGEDTSLGSEGGEAGLFRKELVRR